jgi:hypothetical protein
MGKTLWLRPLQRDNTHDCAGRHDMSKLLRLRKWLPLADAARVLSGLMEEDISESDLLRLALDRQLTLSAHFVNGAWVREWVVLGDKSAKSTDVPRSAEVDFPELPESAPIVGGAIRLSEGDPLMQLMGPVMLSEPDVWDLPMISANVVEVEREYQRLRGGPERKRTPPKSIAIQTSSGRRYELYVRKDESEEAEAAGHSRWIFGHPDDFNPARSLPSDSTFVVRTEALMALQAKLAQPESPKKQVDHLSTRERDTILKLVIGMAMGGYGFDPAAPKSPVPGEISGDLAKHGISVSDDTVRKWLKEAITIVLPTHQSKS